MTGGTPPRKIKILAPAGDGAMLRAAVFSGADAVYLGLRGFNARRGAGNFDAEGLAEAAAFCRARGCEVYAAVNTLALPGEEDALAAAIAAVDGAGCDAVIVQDLAAAHIARSVAPRLALHASTQMSVHSAAGVARLAEWGFSRVILARELSFDEIAGIAKSAAIELEVFVHGALCLSVSGQCYASAFLGGRSGNRGACAGTCRLPFCAARAPDTAAFPRGGRPPARDGQHALSLKDLSILHALPRLQAIGVAAAKIEGRLRGPEYCAAAVSAARAALDGRAYDTGLLRDVFSRSGFTDGWFTGENGGDMFGRRTAEDTKATAAALPRVRELYRRERPRVPVLLSLEFGPAGGALTARAGNLKVSEPVAGPLPAAAADNAAALGAALQKTGGTPFYAAEPPTVRTGGAFLPVTVAGRLRRAALERLLKLAERRPKTAPAAAPPVPPPEVIGTLPAVWAAGEGRARREGEPPLLRARFESAEQLPENAYGLCRFVLLPLAQARLVPRALRGKTILYLPRVLFGGAEREAADMIAAARELGFAGYEAQNIAHLPLCEGLPLSGGFGLNVTNAAAARVLAAAGCGVLTLSPELSARQMRALTEGLAGLPVRTDALCYGHMPLMLTRACPLKQLPETAKCGRVGMLTDRLGEAFWMLCANGARSIHNPRPLWTADRPALLPTDYATLYFTCESRRDAGEILRAFSRGEAARGAFTRGLYERGTEAFQGVAL